MNCSIINHSTATSLGDDGERFEKYEFSASALQSPEVSRLALNSLIRRQQRTKQGPARAFWAHLLSRTHAANGNSAEA